MRPRFLFPLMFLTLAMTACKSPQSQQASLTNFDSCNEMEDWLKDNAIESINAYGYWPNGWWWGGWNGCFDCALEGDGAPAADNSGGAGSFSTTNVQEAGVDEADFVKNDDQYIYVVSGEKVKVIDAWPTEDMTEIATLDIEGYPADMYLAGSTLVVFSSLYGEAPAPASGDTLEMVQPNFGLAKATVFDVTDPSAPVVTRELYYDGYMYSSRRIGNKLHLVVYHPVRGPATPEWQPAYDLNPELYRAALRSAVRNSTIEDWMPSKADLRRGTDGNWTKNEEWAAGCTEVAHPNEHHGLGFVSVQTLDLEELGNDNATAVLANVGQVYAGTENLYVAESVWGDHPWWWSEGDMHTRIHKFDLATDPDHPTYTVSGDVPGWLLNQFSMSDYNGDLRVATTEGWWGPETSNNVFVMRDSNSGRPRMETVGEIRDIAPGETIFAVRFLDERGFVVTFERVDPLFTIDLSDPTDPRIVGQLEITGFSNYLHPVGDTHLIGLGNEADQDGRVIGMQVSLFDVSDMTDPQMDARETILTGYAWSEAQWDHHAFNYFDEYDALALPVVIYDDTDWNWTRVFTGLNVYIVTPEGGITLQGQLDQTSLAANTPEIDPYYDSWCSQVRRSVFMEDKVYAISAGGIVAAGLADLNTHIAQVPFDDWGGCYTGWVE